MAPSSATRIIISSIGGWLAVGFPGSAGSSVSPTGRGQACSYCWEDQGIHRCDSESGAGISEACGHGWQPGGCYDHHVPCGGTEENAVLADVRRVADAIQAGDAGRLAALIAPPTNRVRWNASRAAVQVVGCGGRVVAHWPVDGAVARRLAVVLTD